VSKHGSQAAALKGSIMGISALYYRMQPRVFESFRSDERVREFILWGEGEVEGLEFEELDIDKDWDALRYALGMKSIATDEKPALLFLFEGGTDTGMECTYGTIRLLSPQIVKDISAALTQIPVESVKQRLDVGQFRKHDIYPDGSSWTKQSVNYVLLTFDAAKDFFSRASASQDIVIAGQW
jgi:hypothetical protein